MTQPNSKESNSSSFRSTRNMQKEERVVFVDKVNGPHRSIQDAVDAAQPNSDIRIEAVDSETGQMIIYNENIIIT